MFTATSNNGWMPLHFAVFRGETACVEQLLIACDNLQHRLPSSTATADVLSATVAQRYTALDIAVLGGKLELVNLLQRYGAVSSALATHRIAMDEETVVDGAGSKADEQAADHFGKIPEDAETVGVNGAANALDGVDENLSAFSPQSMPATHVAALLGDFQMLHRLFGPCRPAS